MLDLRNCLVFGVGNEGEAVTRSIAASDGITDIKYTHHLQPDIDTNLFVPFFGSIEYLYGERNFTYEVKEYDKQLLYEVLNQLPKSAIVVLCLAEPISHVILEMLVNKTITFAVRIPFKFENSHNYEKTKLWVNILMNRSDVFLLNSEVYVQKFLYVNYPALRVNMVEKLSNFVRLKLGL